MESDFELEENDFLESFKGTTLESLNPDSWNNIPFCLIQGIKCCKESCLASIQNLEDLSHKMDRTNNQLKNTNHVLTNQLMTAESKLMTKIEDLERYARKMINESIGLVTSKSEYIEILSAEVKKKMDKVTGQVEAKLDDIFGKEELKTFVFDQIKENLENVVIKSLQQQKEELVQMLVRTVQVQGLIGPQMQYEEFKDWILAVQARFEVLEQQQVDGFKQVREKVDKGVETAQQEQEEYRKTNDDRLKQLEESLEGMVIENKQQNQKYRIHNNFNYRDNIKKEISELEKQFEERLQSIKKDLLSENQKRMRTHTYINTKLQALDTQITHLKEHEIMNLADSSKQFNEKINSLESTIEAVSKRNQKYNNGNSHENSNTSSQESRNQANENIPARNSFEHRETVFSQFKNKDLSKSSETAQPEVSKLPESHRFSMKNNVSQNSKNMNGNQIAFLKKNGEKYIDPSKKDSQKLRQDLTKNSLRAGDNGQKEQLQLIKENSYMSDHVEGSGPTSDLNEGSNLAPKHKKESQNSKRNFGNKSLIPSDQEIDDEVIPKKAPVEITDDAVQDFISKMAKELKRKKKSSDGIQNDMYIKDEEEKHHKAMMQDKSQVLISPHKKKKSRKLKLAEVNSQRRALRLNEMLKNPVPISHKRSVSGKRREAIDNSSTSFSGAGFKVDAMGYHQKGKQELDEIIQNKILKQKNYMRGSTGMRSRSIVGIQEISAPSLNFPPINRSINPSPNRHSSFDESPGRNNSVEPSQNLNISIPAVKNRKKIKKSKNSHRAKGMAQNLSFMSPVENKGMTIDNFERKYITNLNSRVEANPRELQPETIHMTFEGNDSQHVKNSYKHKK
ncbi:unnamed protein product [Moneuplotes crassus]|uniref:Uncharacterized protein n=1 Tax=Euplotes crassus TaxID=5936 RepID=A0AAD1Y337_EUPCR|nr:unnamed protein product [Moneuplotes crassus]